MSGIVALWDAWCARQRRAGFEGRQGVEPLTREELERYEAAFWRRGFELPGDLRALLEARGIVWVTPIESDEGETIPGLRLLNDLWRLDDDDRHLELAELNGVAAARHWLLFTTERGDLEPAWAFDHRFGAQGVGSYHQDLVCTDPVGEDEPLPLASPNLEAWLAAKLDDIETRRRGLSLESLPQEQHPVESFTQQQAAVLARVEARHQREALNWKTLDRDWRYLASGTRDEAVLRQILEGVRRDRQQGRPGVPFDAIARGGSWPWDYPGPAQLAARLDEPSRRKVMAWALERAGGTALSAAIETLRSGQPGSRELQRQVSAAGWVERAIDLSTPAGRGRVLARASALALSSDLSESNMERVLTLCANVGGGAPGAWNLLDAWDHLEEVLAGRTQPGIERAAPPPESALVHELRAYVQTHPGPQRALADDLATSWGPRLTTAAPTDRESLTRVLKSALKSPKLAEALSALLARLP
ncbi:hypothetical protein LXT21_30335 [Myxococcus sp. K38C18041901]|uniref:hypothetical protein n=1 Tax=Myxococcus guangdongensis TaxID=2906760 RepID=UPI0020A74DAE|nr:hypothetical protein [Myxococcus guangdongensis]MCP3063082.1 hypothetical protein [Myxococcus guangdongensis]